MWVVTFTPEAKKLSFQKFKEMFWNVKALRHLEDEARTRVIAEKWQEVTGKTYKPSAKDEDTK